MTPPNTQLMAEVKSCRICHERFAQTATRHGPRPVVWFQPGARILVAGQAPGHRVHEAGRPFWDRSGDRLRSWMGINKDTFYDRGLVAIVPMAFCFPGYSPNKSDLPPPPVCATTWRARILEELGEVPLTLLIGSYAQNWHLGKGPSVQSRVERWRSLAPETFVLPHPSWRNTAWLARNPWFEADLVPALRARVQEVLA